MDITQITSASLSFFSVFLAIILILLFIDLFIISRRNHVISLKESVSWSLFWIALAIGFYFFIRFHGELIHGLKTTQDILDYNQEFGLGINFDGLSDFELKRKFDRHLSQIFLAGFLIEKSLSLDNIFIMLLIFLSMNVPEMYYKRVLFWGILGAIIMRFIFIFTLSEIIHYFSWILYFFGVLLLYLAFKVLMGLIRKKPPTINVEDHSVVKFAKRILPVYPTYVGPKFFHRDNGKLFITPLFITLLVIEFSDLIFAVDSIPAVFAVSLDPFIVFYSNIFAILGLRSLFFLLSNFIGKMYYVKFGLAFLLAFVGFKLLTKEFIQITIDTSLIIIASILTVIIISSLTQSYKVRKS